MKSRKMYFGLLVLVVAMSGSAQAATYWWESGAAEWQDNSWTSTAADDVYVGSPIRPDVKVASEGNVCRNFIMGAHAVGGGTFTMESGELTFDEFRMDARNEAIPDTLKLVGGTITNNVGINLWAWDASTLQVIGNGVTMAGSGGVINYGIVEFVIDSTGISTMPWALYMNQPDAVIRLTTAEGAVPGTYDLLNGTLGNPGYLNWEFDDPDNWDVSNFLVDGTVELKLFCGVTRPSPADGDPNVPVNVVLSWEEPIGDCFDCE